MNQKMNILKALGIIFMVGVHCGNDVFRYLPSWRMPMFIFLSGYFFKEEYVDSIKKYALKKFKSLILPMYGWHILYGAVVTALLSLGYIKFGSKLSLKNLVIDSILHGHQYVFSLALWFVPILFLVQICYVLLKKAQKSAGGDRRIFACSTYNT